MENDPKVKGHWKKRNYPPPPDRNRTSFSFGPILFAGLGLFIFIVFIKRYGHPGTWISHGSRPSSWEEVFSVLPQYIGASFLATILLWLGALFGLGNTPTKVICEDCGKIKSEDEYFECSCGGIFVDFNLMEFHSDDDSDPTSENNFNYYSKLNISRRDYIQHRFNLTGRDFWIIGNNVWVLFGTGITSLFIFTGNVLDTELLYIFPIAWITVRVFLKYREYRIGRVYESFNHLHDPIEVILTENMIRVYNTHFDRRASWNDVEVYTRHDGYLGLLIHNMGSLFLQIDDLKDHDVYITVLSLIQDNGVDMDSMIGRVRLKYFTRTMWINPESGGMP